MSEGLPAAPLALSSRDGYFARVPKFVITVVNGPVIRISYVADESASDFVARL